MGDWMRKDERRSNTRENIGWDGMGWVERKEMEQNRTGWYT